MHPAGRGSQEFDYGSPENLEESQTAGERNAPAYPVCFIL
jgi:hypothetical protein